MLGFKYYDESMAAEIEKANNEYYGQGVTIAAVGTTILGALLGRYVFLRIGKTLKDISPTSSTEDKYGWAHKRINTLFEEKIIQRKMEVLAEHRNITKAEQQIVTMNTLTSQIDLKTTDMTQTINTLNQTVSALTDRVNTHISNRSLQMTS